MRIRQIRYVVPVIIIVLLGCASAPDTKPVNRDEVVVFPLPPAQPRIQYLTKFTTASDLKPPGKLQRFLFGGNSGTAQVLQKPYGITVHDNTLYVCDTKLNAIALLNLRDHTFRMFRPGGLGVLRKPVNLTLDNQGNLYIADTGRNQVVVFSKEKRFVRAISNESFQPLDVEIVGDSLLIADYTDRNIEVYSLRDSTFLNPLPAVSNLDSISHRLFVPYSITTDLQRNIYVTDFAQAKIIKYSPRGKYLRSFGGLGRSLGKFARPKGLAVDRENRLYVVDSMFENVQMFDADGNLLMFFGGHYENPGDMYLPAQIYIDYNGIKFFNKYVLPGYSIKYLIYVTNQFGPDKVAVYGFLAPSK